MPTDIRAERFIFRSTPPAWHPYIKLARLDRPVGIWLLLLPGWWSIVLAGGGGYYLTLFALGAVLMRAAGCVVNDLWDRRLDAQVERTRTRPLASGEVSPRQALVFLFVLLSLSLAILLQMNALTIALGFLSLLPVVLYPLMKRVTWWPQLFLGLTFNWGALMGWATATGTIAPAAWLMYAGGIFWTLAYDTVYAHQDKQDDALVGIKSTARLFGDKSRIFVGLSLVLALALFALAKGALTPLLLLPALHAAWQICRWDMRSPESCLSIFKSNVIFGLFLLIFFYF